MAGLLFFLVFLLWFYREADMQPTVAQIPGAPKPKKKAGYNLSRDVLADLAELRRDHRINLSEFVEDAIRDSLRRHARRAQQSPTPAA